MQQRNRELSGKKGLLQPHSATEARTSFLCSLYCIPDFSTLLVASSGECMTSGRKTITACWLGLFSCLDVVDHCPTFLQNSWGTLDLHWHVVGDIGCQHCSVPGFSMMVPLWPFFGHFASAVDCWSREHLSSENIVPLPLYSNVMMT